MQRKPRKRPVHYITFAFSDGAAVSCVPTRKPSKRKAKLDGLHIDEDLVTQEFRYGAKEFGPWSFDQRVRAADLLTNRLNTRRAIRELLLPVLATIQASLHSLHERIERIERIENKLAIS